MKLIQLKLPDELHKQIRQTALAQDHTMHDMAVEMLRAYMTGICHECGLPKAECGADE